MMSIISTLLLLLALVQAPIVAVSGTFYPADDQQFAYSGRWEVNSGSVARANWPCSGVQFHLVASPSSSSSLATSTSSSTIAIALRLNLLRVRLHVEITNTRTGEVVLETILEGGGIYDYAKNNDLQVPLLKDTTTTTTTYTVSLTKLTQAAPYGNGVGRPLTSMLEFYGVEVTHHVVTLAEVAPRQPSRRMALIGASDTAGFCVDGTPETSDAKIKPHKYDNCHKTSHGVLSRRLDAELSVQAISGIGLTQNAFADKPFLLGRPTMPDYYDRALQTRAEPQWDFAAWRPDLVVVSLGGNDFNHQKVVPSNATFRAAYEDFLWSIAEPYLTSADDDAPTIVSVCGQGDPTEVERDPNNDRCRPCPHVQEATESFRSKHETIRVEYIFIPCDGTVVTGIDDIGCEGHKNRLGQQRVADFLEPRLREIMAWPAGVLSKNEKTDPPPPLVVSQHPQSSSSGSSSLPSSWNHFLRHGADGDGSRHSIAAYSSPLSHGRSAHPSQTTSISLWMVSAFLSMTVILTVLSWKRALQSSSSTTTSSAAAAYSTVKTSAAPC